MLDDKLSYDEQIDEWSKLIAHYRFYPDTLCDVLRPIDPETGKRTGFELTYHQRIFLRGVFRYGTSFVCVSRGYGKTTVMILALYLLAILYPGCTIRLGAQSNKQSAKLFREKHDEIVNKMFPALANEIAEAKIAKDDVLITFKNNSVVGSVGLNQNEKGGRAVGVIIEEAGVVLEDSTIYQDAIHPIINTQYKSPKNEKPDFWFVNKACYVTTSYFKNNCFDFNISTIKKMMDGDGFVFGASYMLPAMSGVGKTVKEYEAMRPEYSEIYWRTNYLSRWLTGNDSCIVDMEKLKSLQVIPKPETKGEKGSEYFISADIARSASDKNARTAIVVAKIKRNKEERVRSIEVVNLYSLPSGTPYQEQALWIRRFQKIFNAKVVCIDANGVGSAIVDILLESQRDNLSGEDYPAWDTLNSDIKSQEQNAIPMVYCVLAQRDNETFLVHFMKSVSNGALKLLEPIDSNMITDTSSEDLIKSEILPKVRCMQLVDEIGNLSIDSNSGSNKLKVKQTIKMTKDMFSALQYLVGTVYEDYDNPVEENEYDDISSFFSFTAPKIR
nr:MAG TPA: large terminase [Caudoviricetes sp.]